MLDYDEWHCFQCGRVYYPRPSATDLPLDHPLDHPEAQHPLPTSIPPGVANPNPKRRRARRINAVIEAKKRSEEKWWSSNQQVIHHLDQGRSVREVAEILGRDPRQVRVIRERLHDLRAATAEPVAAD